MMTPTKNTLNIVQGHQSGTKPLSQAELVQQLLYQIVRVKELIKYYDSIPKGAGQLGSAILNELIAEAHGSLINYDTLLMEKYYDLLQHCD